MDISKNITKHTTLNTVINGPNKAFNLIFMQLKISHRKYGHANEKIIQSRLDQTLQLYIERESLFVVSSK